MNNRIITFNAKAFLNSAHIEYVTEGPKTTKNRINVHCPFCTGSRKYHLGIHVTDGYANCWRCGSHSILKVIRALLNTTWNETYKILDEFKDVSNIKVTYIEKNYNNSEVILPGVIEPLKDIHQNYLYNIRNFDPLDIMNTWDIKSVGPTGMCKHRIFIPIYYRNQLVSYQCRSIISKVGIHRYITCPPKKEKIFHKSILYGLDYAISDTVVVVEGVTDVWRLGAGAVGTFGINYMKEQVFQLSKYKNIYIIFDPEKQAQKQAEKLASELSFLKSRNVYIIDISKTGAEDPGSLIQNEANTMMSDIMTGVITTSL